MVNKEEAEVSDKSRVLKRNIVLLGLVSLITDVSSEIMMPVLPLFIVALGGSAIVIGLIGGVSDSIASFFKVFSGRLSDKFRQRKKFVVGGYSTSAVSKLGIALSVTWPQVFITRSIERTGKGLRDAPRDAIIAGSISKEVRGKAFGIHRAMDTTGAIFGAFLAYVFFWHFGLSLRAIIAIGAFIAFFALIPLIPVKEPKEFKGKEDIKIGWDLPESIKMFLIVATLFALANFSYMFFIIFAQQNLKYDEDQATAIAILLYVLFNIVYASFAVPSGILSDKLGRKKVLVAGYTLFGFMCLGFAISKSLLSMIILFIAYGAAFALIRGNERAFISDLAQPERRGYALGSFHAMVGFAALPSSLIAGFLWEYFSATATFLYGSIMAFTAAIFFLLQKYPEKTKLIT